MWWITGCSACLLIEDSSELFRIDCWIAAGRSSYDFKLDRRVWVFLAASDKVTHWSCTGKKLEGIVIR